MEKIFNILILATGLFPLSAFAVGDSDIVVDTVNVSTGSLQAADDASADSGETNSIDIAAPVDSSTGAFSAGESMYKAALPAMRRDAIPVVNTDTMIRTKKNAEPKIIPPSVTTQPAPEKKDSFLVESAHQTSSGQKTGITKKGVIITVGVCALIGGGIAAFLINKKSGNSADELNNRISNPPDPPDTHFFNLRD